MFIGRIITNSKKISTLDFVDITNRTEIDNSVPTLIIGKQLAESIYGANRIHVLDKRIENNVQWTFARNERRKDFENELEKFNNSLLKKLNKGVEYEYFNVFTEPLSRIKLFVKFMEGKYRKYIYLTYDHLYIYHSKKNKVWGLSLRDLEYCGVSSKKVLSKIYSNPFNIMVKDDGFIKGRLRESINKSKILVPYLYFLQNQ